MTVARSMQINQTQTRYYHVVSRCVRRAFLCGWDKLTRKNFDHRKEWLVERMKTLSSIFSIHCAAYAAMQNHLHFLNRLGVEQSEWVRTVVDFSRRFRFAAGSIGQLEKWCEAIGRSWLQGRKAAGALYVQPT